ncbi:elongation factor Ts [Chlamydia suis]|uniref:Elongation factor Ts n=1 Tax=Chlamydia suis TaxID=83559 RepID=A0AAQ0ELR0_9CHLA|nr:translation elongation factor Ts [Chlamydia suis]MEB2681500.1 translation elongation factor Ts [Chlamydia suis]MEB2681630.1 translation elongation factor Ts [Chlamydia suis]MEB2682551.1 translation elongation factor Ts [Chlamydia suis]MEB2684208.1 translation elongation factor Ts [Chlamydia suis]MEB2684366.1 translation elongation factor Ts [Chlamydia suis]
MSDFSMETLKNLRQQTGVGLTKCKEALEHAKGNLEDAVLYLRKLGLASASKKEHRETKEGVIAALVDERGSAIIEVNVETDFVANNSVFRTFVTGLLSDLLNNKLSDVDALAHVMSSQEPSLSVEELRAVTMQTVGENIRITRALYTPVNSGQSIGVYSHGNGKAVAVVFLSGSEKQEALAKDIAMHIVASQPQFLSKETVPQEVLEREREVFSSQIAGKPQEVIERITKGKFKAFFQETCLLEQAFIKDPEITIRELVDRAARVSGEPLKVEHFIFWKIGA